MTPELQLSKDMLGFGGTVAHEHGLWIIRYTASSGHYTKNTTIDIKWNKLIAIRND